MFTSNQNKGFSLTFENGLTISVQFGAGNYCENYYKEYNFSTKEMQISCKDAEIAIWDKEDKWFDFESDIVKGRVTANEVADWITRVKNAENIQSV